METFPPNGPQRPQITPWGEKKNVISRVGGKAQDAVQLSHFIRPCFQLPLSPLLSLADLGWVLLTSCLQQLHSWSHTKPPPASYIGRNNSFLGCSSKELVVFNFGDAYAGIRMENWQEVTWKSCPTVLFIDSRPWLNYFGSLALFEGFWFFFWLVIKKSYTSQHNPKQLVLGFQQHQKAHH